MTSSDAQALQSAIARVGEVFSGMAANPAEAGCLSCYSAGDIASLKAADIALPVDLVLMVAQEVPSHWDDHRAVLRRVLPQVLPLLADGTASADAVAYGVAAAGWTDWAPAQAGALHDFFRAWLIWTLGQETAPTAAHEVLESCAIASSAVTPWLAVWATQEHPAAARHLREAADWWQEDLERGVSPFRRRWWGSEAQEQQACRELASWLAAREPR